MSEKNRYSIPSSSGEIVVLDPVFQQPDSSDNDTRIKVLDTTLRNNNSYTSTEPTDTTTKTISDKIGPIGFKIAPNDSSSSSMKSLSSDSSKKSIIVDDHIKVGEESEAKYSSTINVSTSSSVSSSSTKHTSKDHQNEETSTKEDECKPFINKEFPTKKSNTSSSSSSHPRHNHRTDYKTSN